MRDIAQIVINDANTAKSVATTLLSVTIDRVGPLLPSHSKVFLFLMATMCFETLKHGTRILWSITIETCMAQLVRMKNYLLKRVSYVLIIA